MGRSPCCEKVRLKKGPWTAQEDHKLLAYIEQYGHGSWRALPSKAGLQRCGKSCRLRWINYLRPGIKRGKFSLQEEQTIIQLHALLGNRWSVIAAHLPMRTDNEIKNHWNTHLKKRLTRMGIDPMTHKPMSHALGPNLSHMAQWEGARLEAEARLVQESKLKASNAFQTQLSSSASAQLVYEVTHTTPLPAPPLQPLCLDVLTAWQGSWLDQTPKYDAFSDVVFGATSSLDSLPLKKGELLQLQGLPYSTDDDTLATANESILLPIYMESGLGEIFLDNSNELYPSITGGSSGNIAESCCGDFQENKNYWINNLNIVNCSPSGSPVF